jgi:hypothetical protein
MQQNVHNTTAKKRHTVKRTKRVYTRKHYESNDGMLTAVWGPSMWHYLHTMSFNYPVNPSCDQKRHYRDFVLSLQHVLPCGKCRKNLCKNFKKLPLKWKNMDSRASFSLYIYKLHEIVNKMLKKTSNLSYGDVKERYEHFRARCLAPTPAESVPEKKPAEQGCTEPLYGKKSKCVLQIVPHDTKCQTLKIDKECINVYRAAP